VIKGCRRHLFVFLANRAIPPTNNGSERALRPCVIFRKVTNCFRSEWAAHLYADVRSVIETGRRRAIGALEAIRLTSDNLISVYSSGRDGSRNLMTDQCLGRESGLLLGGGCPNREDSDNTPFGAGTALSALREVGLCRNFICRCFLPVRFTSPIN
jgi:hypothetical protein